MLTNLQVYVISKKEKTMTIRSFLRLKLGVWHNGNQFPFQSSVTA
jgi:hypothetical protein